eukprot:4312033-Prymnesium_polylepis.1
MCIRDRACTCCPHYPERGRTAWLETCSSPHTCHLRSARGRGKRPRRYRRDCATTRARCMCSGRCHNCRCPAWCNPRPSTPHNSSSRPHLPADWTWRLSRVQSSPQTNLSAIVLRRCLHRS